MSNAYSEGGDPVWIMNLQIKTRALVSLTILFSVVGCITATGEGTNSLSGDDYFFVEVFECKFPIPKKFIFTSRAQPITYLVDDFGHELSEEDIQGRITINEYVQPEAAPEIVINRELVYSLDKLELYKLTSKNFEAFSINDSIQMMYFYKGGINQAEIIAMIDFCQQNKR